MQFSEASAYMLPYGQYRGKTMDDVARSDRGLRYLDHMRGVLESVAHRTPNDQEFLQALSAYLNDPVIAKDLESLL